LQSKMHVLYPAQSMRLHRKQLPGLNNGSCCPLGVRCAGLPLVIMVDETPGAGLAPPLMCIGLAAGAGPAFALAACGTTACGKHMAPFR